MSNVGFKLNVRADTKRVIADLRAQLAGTGDRSVVKAQARALNRTVAQLRTEAGKEIRQTYNVSLRGVRQASTVTKARAGGKVPQAVLTFRGRPINLIEFGARQTAKGVTVKVKVAGGRKLIAHAFIQKLKGGQNAGKKGVFRREGKARYPIRFLPSLSLPAMVEQSAINNALLKFADQRYEVNFASELKFVSGS